MILKVERHNKTQDWWLMDNIAKVSCSKLGRKTSNPETGDITILDHEIKCNCQGSDNDTIRERCDKCIYYWRLVCRTKDFNEFSVIFDTVAYLCNDEGKTIEKIVANFKE